MDILAKVKEALALIQQGREAIGAVTDSIKDGKTAIDARTQAELNELLEKERAETREAHDNLQNAINTSRAGG